ncbi:acetyl-CoA carboxylase [Pycnococcus provasolii]
MQTPLLFLNASSGARLGVDEAMKKMLTFAEDGKLVAGGMEVSSVSNPNADYGVPSLSGCGATARAYSRLYDKGFCVTICIGRAVGIGAYLARLGRRTIQVAQTPIILTGQAALNKVLGKDVRAVGVIATQTATTELVVPADPGDFSTSERRIQHPGCLWLPDSAAKTAEALEDMGREHLPIIILSNWRGFSGGLRDLFEGVLQAGSGIVEGLRKYPAPVFVYIPRGAELRGGAWVVLDKQINEHGNVQMFMDPSARGGILEPEGTAEIRFKKAAIREWMERDGADEKDYPKYRAGALQFCDSHDRAEALLAQQVIDGVVDLADARDFFTKKLEELLG